MKVNPYVFFISAILITIFVILGSVFTEATNVAFSAIQAFIINQFGWLYIAAVGGFLIFVLWLLFTPYGKIKLGADDDEPDYSYPTWFAMLFSAGMGIGLLFFSVAEPIMHYTAPRRAEPQTLEAAREAMNLTFFHWGLHAWAIYIVVGLALAYFAYRHNLPLTIRSVLYPLFGERIHGPIGNTVDILAVFGTLFGVATSLGLGVMQINAGLAYLNLLPVSVNNQIILIAVITLIATISVVTGVDVGIRRLSELNLILGLILLLFVFFLGPTVFLLSTLVQSTGRYVSSLVELTFRTDAFIGPDWQASWTMFYWGWWISWSPFVGMFIARISRGRTIREFILGVLLAPTALAFVWMVVFGNTAIHQTMAGDTAISEAVFGEGTLPMALYHMLENLPLAKVTSLLATIVIATYFVTSSDSASLVIDILTANGDPDPPVGQRIFWALSEGFVAAVLLLTGGLFALRTAAIATALPFCVVMVLICWSLVKGLRAEVSTADELAEEREWVRSGGRATEIGPAAAAATAAPLPTPGVASPEAPTSPIQAAAPAAAVAEQLLFTKGGQLMKDWRSQLNEILQRRTKPAAPPRDVEAARRQLEQFIDETVMPAFEELKSELEKNEREVKIERRRYHATITVFRNGKEEFSYAIRGRAYHKMALAFPELSRQREPTIARAEVVLRSGAHHDREITKFTKEQVIADFLDAYAKWMGW